MTSKKSHLVKEIIKEQNKDVCFLEEEFDKAIIGTCLKYGKRIVAAYSADGCLKVLMKKHGCSEMEAFAKFHDSIESKKKENHYPVFINDFRKIKLVDLQKFDLTDTLDKML